MGIVAIMKNKPESSSSSCNFDVHVKKECVNNEDLEIIKSVKSNNHRHCEVDDKKSATSMYNSKCTTLNSSNISVCESLVLNSTTTSVVQVSDIKNKYLANSTKSDCVSKSNLSDVDGPPIIKQVQETNLNIPGAEIKGKPGTPISFTNKLETSDFLYDASDDNQGTNSGGRLTFFKEGKFLLELSHRNEGTSSSWVPVKSKTYWPPYSTATSSTIHHPLRHDTPTTHSDDCSSVNSSPWLGDHIRKQIAPKHMKLVGSFYLHMPKTKRGFRRKTQISRNPYQTKLPDNVNLLENLESTSRTLVPGYEEKKENLDKVLGRIYKTTGFHIESDITLEMLFERSSSLELSDSTFISPRKRYLRQIEDLEPHLKKKVHSGSSSLSALLNDKPNKSAMTVSSYSIDSILSNENANSKKDSCLRNLLKADIRATQPKTSIKELSIDLGMKVESDRSSAVECNAQNKDNSLDISKFYADHANELGFYGSLGNIPYFGLDPRYMMPNILSTHRSDMAAVAAAAAAASSLNPYALHLSALQYSSLLSGSLPPVYTPPVSVGASLLRSPTPSRLSPYPVDHSPNHRLSATPPVFNTQPSHSGNSSPWHIPLISSPIKSPFISSPAQSPPPQDAPLNLSKPKSK